MKSIVSARRDFPLITHLHQQNQIYMDSAATSQKPHVVLESMMSYYQTSNANPRRGTSYMSNYATELMEQARLDVAQFINAPDTSSVIFTKSTTEGLNMIARGWAENHLKAGDEILLTEMEHHSNLLPWQSTARKTGARLMFIPVDEHGEIDLRTFKKQLSSRTRVVALPHVSNVFGSVLPLKEISKLAHDAEAIVVVDGAQAAAHYPIDITDLDIDFYAFSAHKMYGPTGVGILCGRKALLTEIEPLLLGGSMVNHVTNDSVEYADVPYRFEGGTQDVAGIIGLSAAIKYLQQCSWQSIADHEQKLTLQLCEQLSRVSGIRLFASPNGSIVSFAVEHVHPHDVAQVFDSCGITVRSGHHCAEPLMQKLGVPGVVRISVGIYSNQADIEACIKAAQMAVKRFGHG